MNNDKAFPERDMTKPAEQQGVFRKFEVRRVDGSDQPGGKHHGCRYYVLDLDHDQHAPAAMRAYAASCAGTHLGLAADIEREFGAAQAHSPAAIPEGVYRITHDGGMVLLCEVCGDSKSDGHGCFCAGPETMKYGKLPIYQPAKMIHDFDDAVGISAQAEPIKQPLPPREQALCNDGHEPDWNTYAQAEAANATHAVPYIATAADWGEDFAHENGNYENRCSECGIGFMGHKRRFVCKVCATPAQATPGGADLPQLPLTISQYGFNDTPAFTADQVRDYARATLAASQQASAPIISEPAQDVDALEAFHLLAEIFDSWGGGNEAYEGRPDGTCVMVSRMKIVTMQACRDLLARHKKK